MRLLDWLAAKMQLSEEDLQAGLAERRAGLFERANALLRGLKVRAHAKMLRCLHHAGRRWTHADNECTRFVEHHRIVA